MTLLSIPSTPLSLSLCCAYLVKPQLSSYTPSVLRQLSLARSSHAKQKNLKHLNSDFTQAIMDAQKFQYQFIPFAILLDNYFRHLKSPTSPPPFSFLAYGLGSISLTKWKQSEDKSTCSDQNIYNKIIFESIVSFFIPLMMMDILSLNPNCGILKFIFSHLLKVIVHPAFVNHHLLFFIESCSFPYKYAIITLNLKANRKFSFVSITPSIFYLLQTKLPQKKKKASVSYIPKSSPLILESNLIKLSTHYSTETVLFNYKPTSYFAYQLCLTQLINLFLKLIFSLSFRNISLLGLFLCHWQPLFHPPFQSLHMF